uniref:Uncharacterized protein n=1 Tax=Trichuris muris TaxID=70415 RepID=A0A5S6QEJ2_TRIMR
MARAVTWSEAAEIARGDMRKHGAESRRWEYEHVDGDEPLDGEKDDTLGKEAPRSSNIAYTLELRELKAGPSFDAEHVGRRHFGRRTLWPANTLAVANHREPTAKRRARRFAHAPHGDSLRPKCSPAKVFAGQLTCTPELLKALEQPLVMRLPEELFVRPKVNPLPQESNDKLNTLWDAAVNQSSSTDASASS